MKRSDHVEGSVLRDRKVKNDPHPRWQQRTEVGVLHGLAGREPRLVVVAQQLVQEVQGLGAHQVLVLTVNKTLPSLARMSAQEWGEREASRNEDRLQTWGLLLAPRHNGPVEREATGSL